MAPTFPDLARDVEQTAPRLGAARMVVVDGPAGSGKSTFAGRYRRYDWEAGRFAEEVVVPVALHC